MVDKRMTITSKIRVEAKEKRRVDKEGRREEEMEKEDVEEGGNLVGEEVGRR